MKHQHINDRYAASARHALEVHVSACLMYAEMQWRRSITNLPRDQVIQTALREACEKLAHEAQKRAGEVRPEDLDP